ncbi:MAG: hypothetical protein HOW97_29605, partial [Catenulispora sp.]|nr:hypothetical protein [Catenulispora sp.]
MGDIGSEPYGDGEHAGEDHRRNGRHRASDRPGDGVLSDAEAERLLNGPWALNTPALGASDGTGTETGEHRPKPTDLPDLGISAVAGRPARMAYSAGWDGADDPGGHAAWRPDRSAGSTDSGGEMTVSSVDFPTDLASPDAQAVARLLAAATAPPGADELRGYEAARRAFERAGATQVRRGAG